MEYTRGMKTIQVDYENKIETYKVKLIELIFFKIISKLILVTIS